MKVLQFNELLTGKKYNVNFTDSYGVIGKTLEYTYEIVRGVLHNVDKSKKSSLGYNQNIVFTEVEPVVKRKYRGLDFDVEFGSTYLRVGCQKLPLTTAKSIATDILNHYS